jgi:hypothetical protein
MRKLPIIVVLLALGLSACSPRDVLTRRLAGDLIAGSNAFRVPQEFVLRTGLISNRDYVSPEYLVLQQRGWISATSAACPASLAPPPCWDVSLTPSGVETIRFIVPPVDAEKLALQIPAASRELLEITGISKQGNVAEVDFVWRWMPLNEIGGALYAADLRYKSTVEFRNFDDGWRLMQASPRPGQDLDEALRNSEPEP